MPAPTPTTPNTTAAPNALDVSAAASRLQPFLALHPPASADDTPPALSFRRKRRVELPWDTILGEAATAGETSIVAIREYFESSWGLGTIDKASLARVLEGDAPRLKALQTAGRDDKGKPVPLKMVRADPAAAGAPEPDGPLPTVDSGLVVQHGTSGRWYLMVARGGTALGPDDLASVAAYEKMWKDKVDGVELVFDSAGAANSGVTRFSEVDLRPGVIHRAFNELLIHKDFADRVAAGAAQATQAAVERITSTTLDVDELQRLQDKSFRLRMQAWDAQRRLDRLVTQAADLGYYLFLESKSFKFPGGSETKVEPGQIYTQFRRTASWVTTHHRNITVSKGWWIFAVSKLLRQAYTQSHAQVVTDYSRVDTTRDPLVEAVAARRAQGMAVFVFEPGPAGFVTSDGMPLREVMAQCDRSEAFRQRCVVMLPVHEESLTGQRVLTKYGVFERPLPGISASALPQLSLLESLSYRTAWQHCQLGELVSTINLAPGEERTVLLSRSFEQERTVSRSSTSIFDLSRSDSTDLATEMENQARQEREQSSQMSFSASAGGSWGPFSASASASGGSSQSLKAFSQAISKVARKASQAVNQQQREEVSTSSTERTTMATKDETSATLRNINQGRTLNLVFHRVLNRFEGGIYLDELQFEVVPGTEVIGGSGVYESLRFTLDELPELLEQFRQTRLPFDLAPADAPGYVAKVVASVKALLEAEYLDSDGGAGSGTLPALRGARSAARARPAATVAAARAATTSVARMSLGPPAAAPAPAASAPRTRGAARAAPATVAADAAVAEFVARLRGATVDRDTPILVDELLLASGGLYLDAMVGAQPGTEPYSEQMRVQEVRLRDAEVRKLHAEAEHLLAQAGVAVAPTGNAIVAMLPDAEHTSLRLQVREPLARGAWSLLLDGARKAGAKCDGDDQRIVEFRWRGAQDWLHDEGLAARVSIEQASTGERIGFAA